MYDFDVSIIKIADDFYEAYRRCIEPNNPREVKGGVSYSVVNVPAIVNATFAIELYFKSIISKEKYIKLKNGHSLKDLFDLLDNNIKIEIKNEILQNDLNGKTFEKCLEGISDAFVFWRYIHEKQDFDFGLNNSLYVISVFIDVIREKVKDYLIK